MGFRLVLREGKDIIYDFDLNDVLFEEIADPVRPHGGSDSNAIRPDSDTK